MANLYGYVANDLINLVDLTGENPILLGIGVGIGIMLGIDTADKIGNDIMGASLASGIGGVCRVGARAWAARGAAVAARGGAQVASGAAQAAKLGRQLAAEEVAGGHAFAKHVVQGGHPGGSHSSPVC